MLGSRQSQHSFAQIPSVHMARSQFDRSFGVKDTFNFDYLVPVLVDEVLPGDTANLNASVFARLATQKVPIMDNMHLEFFFFFVPNRLLWSNWEKFCGAQDNPGDSISYVLPTMSFTANNPAVDTVFDKMGLPVGVPNAWTLSNCLPLRAYNRIWNEWFRDENLQNRVVQNSGDGPDSPADYTLLKRGKRHDYFTSALPWAQKGTPVTLALGTTAPVYGTGKALGLTDGATNYGMAMNTGTFSLLPYTGSYNANNGATASGSYPGYGKSLGVVTSGVSGLQADLSAAVGPTINSLRQAIMIQGMLELDARGGTRYVELLRSHFNVVSPDFRLQRSEYLGGGKVSINSHPVPNSSGTGTQANLAAFGTASGSGIGFTKSFVEHGYIIGLASARADITYQQGLNRMWNRSTRYDFFWPKLQELGEQTILNKEIYLDGSANDAGVFGYQERYAEYRYKPSEIHGKFRSTLATPVDQWHLAEKFSSLPALNSTFVQSTTPIERAIAVTTEPHLIVDLFYNYKHARPMMTYSVPATLGRF